MNYNEVPQGTKWLQVIAGLLPPAITWWLTGDWVQALIVFGIGAIGGMIVFRIFLKSRFPDSARMADGGFTPEFIEQQTRSAMPVFLWAGPVIGAIAALYFILT